MMWYGMGGWGYVLMTISSLAFVALLVAAIVVLVRSSGRTGQRQPSAPYTPPTPEQLLAERFARGDIDADDYRQRVEVLRTGGRAT
ncbi:hypothetical protein GCM10010517_78890 [Streptosporangium fragile]|uniref:SHOCT domain-containing protein n=2 Tax=Streptosporangium fragile TaxID=46186 RepID=A0ABN3WEG0_9ACTN